MARNEPGGRQVRFDTSMAVQDEPVKLVVKKTFIELDESDHAESVPRQRQRSSMPASVFRFDGDDWLDNDEDTTPLSVGVTEIGMGKMCSLNSEQSQTEAVEAETTDAGTTSSSNSSTRASCNSMCLDATVDASGSADNEPTSHVVRPMSAGAEKVSQRQKEAVDASSSAAFVDSSQGSNLSFAPNGLGSLGGHANLAAIEEPDRDMTAIHLELQAAELKLAALRAEAAVQRARAQGPTKRSRPAAAAAPPAPAPFMPPAMHPPGAFPGPYMPPPGQFVPMPMPGYPPRSGDASARYPAMGMPFDPSFYPSNLSMPPHMMPYQAADQPQRSTAPVKVDHSEQTTVMLRNLPNDYTRDMVAELMDSEGFAGKYDFLYLPFDFKRQAGLGYAFMNLITPEEAMRAMVDLQGFTDWKVPTQKVLQVSWSNPLQGLAANIERYRNSPVMHPDVPERFKPLLLKHGQQVPFPMPTKPLLPPELKKGTDWSGYCGE